MFRYQFVGLVLIFMCRTSHAAPPESAQHEGLTPNEIEQAIAVGRPGDLLVTMIAQLMHSCTDDVERIKFSLALIEAGVFLSTPMNPDDLQRIYPGRLRLQNGGTAIVQFDKVFATNAKLIQVVEGIAHFDTGTQGMKIRFDFGPDERITACEVSGSFGQPQKKSRENNRQKDGCK